MINKYFISETKEFNDDDRTLTAWASTDDVDRDGESLAADGWELKQFKKNPVLMAAHDYRKFPIGKVIWIKPDPSDKPKGLKFKAQFAETDEGLDAWYLYRNGYMNAFSVGFAPLEEPIFDEKADGKKKPRRIYPKNELLEISCVPVPANAMALVEAEKGVKTKAFKEIIEDMIKSVIPYHDYGNADEGESWDGPGTMAQCDTAKLKKICAWYDSDNPDVKSSYKLPHHNVNLKAVWRGVANAMARLPQTDIPSGDKAGVYNHLAKHYKDFGKEPPGKSYEDFEAKQMATADQVKKIWEMAIGIQEMLKEAGSGYVTISQVRIEISQLDSEADEWNRLGIDPQNQKHIDIDQSDINDLIDDDIDLGELLGSDVDALAEGGDISENDLAEILAQSGDDAGIDELLHELGI